jgi:ATP-dependent Lhr-like helicase
MQNERHQNDSGEVVKEEFDQLIGHMIKMDYLREDGDMLIIGETGEQKFLRAGWRRLFAVFDSLPLYEIYSGKEQVGTLDAQFVEVQPQIPFYFVLAGKRWTAFEVDWKAKIVRVRPTNDATAPNWKCMGGFDVPFVTAQKVGALLMSNNVPSYLDEEATEALEALQWEFRYLSWKQRCITLATHRSMVKIYTFAGDRINRTISNVIKLAELGKVSSDYYSIEIKNLYVPVETLADNVLNCLKKIGDEANPKMLADSLLESMPKFPFSPFAQCLPKDLHSKALIEQHLDIEGTIALLRNGDFCVIDCEKLIVIC